jgi:hypothetical protein
MLLRITYSISLVSQNQAQCPGSPSVDKLPYGVYLELT